MWPVIKDFFTSRDAFARSMRAVFLGASAAALTPGAQELIGAQLGPWGALLVPALAAILGGGVAVGEKNAKPEE